MDHEASSSSENNGGLSDAIIRTVVFFDLFDFPLTAWEVWRFGEFAKLVTPTEVSGGLEEQVGLDILVQKEGYYFLKGREAIVEERKKRYNYADRKFKRALAITKLFRLAPWVGLVAVANQIGSHNLRDEGDIDLFVVASAGRLWLTRLWCVGVAKLLGRRPDERTGRTRDTICLNFFLAEDQLNLEKFLLGKDDIYFIYWLASLTPIYDKDGAYETLIAANSWFEVRLPNWQPLAMSHRRRVSKIGGRTWYRLVDFLFGGFEIAAKRLQLAKLPHDLKTKMNQGTEVVIDDQVLKLHSKDRRSYYQNKFIEKLAELNIS